MSNKKYELTNETIEVFGSTLYRIKALRDFGCVNKGQLGGFIESEFNLSHNGTSWVHDEAKVYERGRVLENANITKSATVCGCAIVGKKATVEDKAVIIGRAIIHDNAKVCGDAIVMGKAIIQDFAIVQNYSLIHGNAIVGKYSNLGGNITVSDNAKILIDSSPLFLCNNAHIRGDARISSITDMVTIEPLGSQGHTLTAYRSIKHWGTEIEVSMQGILYTLKEFELYISHMRCTDTEIGQYRATIEFLKQFFSVNEGSKNHGRA